MNSLNKAKLLIGIGLIFISYTDGQTILVTDYEYFFQTKNVPSGTTVIFAAVNNNNPRWDEEMNLATGTDSVTLSITGNVLACTTNAFDQGGSDEPSIGFLRYTIKVVNPGKSAWFVLEAQGQLFQGDKFFTYDWNNDLFYTDGDCYTYGTSGIEPGSIIITHVDDGQGNLHFQPTNPTNLNKGEENNHPKFSWDMSLPIFTDVEYKVYRRVNYSTWELIASDRTDITYTDNSVTLPLPCDYTYYYKVRASVNGFEYKESPDYSNVVSYTNPISAPYSLQGLW